MRGFQKFDRFFEPPLVAPQIGRRSSAQLGFRRTSGEFFLAKPSRSRIDHHHHKVDLVILFTVVSFFSQIHHCLPFSFRFSFSGHVSGELHHGPRRVLGARPSSDAGRCPRCQAVLLRPSAACPQGRAPRGWTPCCVPLGAESSKHRRRPWPVGHRRWCGSSRSSCRGPAPPLSRRCAAAGRPAGPAAEALPPRRLPSASNTAVFHGRSVREQQRQKMTLFTILPSQC